ncbi:MAG: CDP-alcohol phosphatidyltransferase family protein [Candidatus Dormibacteria bacterium]
MFSRLLQASVRRTAQRLATWLRLSRLSPNAVTLTGLLLTVVAAVLVALDLLLPAGLVLLLAGSMDILDGAVARAGNRADRFGAFLDSTADRYGEGAIYFGLLYLFLVRLHDTPLVFLVVASLLGSLLVSYVRARAQSLGFECEGGWFARPERVVVTALGLVFAPLTMGVLTVALWILAVLTNFTAFQRIYLVFRQHRDRLRAERVPAPPAAPVVEPQEPQRPPKAKPRRDAAPS